jgi:hypothetical protein
MEGDGSGVFDRNLCAGTEENYERSLSEQPTLGPLNHNVQSWVQVASCRGSGDAMIHLLLHLRLSVCPPEIHCDSAVGKQLLPMFETSPSITKLVTLVTNLPFFVVKLKGHVEISDAIKNTDKCIHSVIYFFVFFRQQT